MALAIKMEVVTVHIFWATVALTVKYQVPYISSCCSSTWFCNVAGCNYISLELQWYLL